MVVVPRNDTAYLAKGRQAVSDALDLFRRMGVIVFGMALRLSSRRRWLLHNTVVSHLRFRLDARTSSHKQPTEYRRQQQATEQGYLVVRLVKTVVPPTCKSVNNRAIGYLVNCYCGLEGIIMPIYEQRIVSATAERWAARLKRWRCAWMPLPPAARTWSIVLASCRSRKSPTAKLVVITPLHKARS